MEVIAQDSTLSVDEGLGDGGDARKAALMMFPDKGIAFNLDLTRPRLQRLMRERFRMQ